MFAELPRARTAPLDRTIPADARAGDSRRSRPGRLLVVLGLVAALVAAGCSTSETGGDEEAEIAGEPTPERPSSPPAGARALSELPGRLALIDDGDVVITNPDGSDRQILDQANFVDQPVWASTGEALAWTSFNGADARVVISSIETVPEEESSGSGSDADSEGSATDSRTRLDLPLEGGPAIYLSWNDTGDRIGILRNGAGPGTFDLLTSEVSMAAGTVDSAELIASGAPLYHSWNAETGAVALHVGNDVGHWIDGVGLSGPYFDSAGSFPTVSWLDAGSVVVADGASIGRLVLPGDEVLPDQLPPFDEDVVGYEPFVEVDGATRFVVSPDGSRLAYLAPADPDLFTIASDRLAPRRQSEQPTSALHVLDLASGEVSIVGGPEVRRLQPRAWEWSPDGQTLAVLAPGEIDPNQFRWHFWQQGFIRATTSSFTPSRRTAQSYLPFFDQYAQSITGWSPDGQAFAFAGTSGDEIGVFVHIPGVTPRSIRVGSGEVVTWSPANVATGGGVSML